MTNDVQTVSPAMTVREAINLLLNNKISGAPIVDQTGTLLSVVSQTDLMKFAAQGELEVNIQSKLDKLVKPDKLITALKSDTFVTVFKVFLTTRIRRVLIVDGAYKLQGIVSRSAILKVFMEHNT